MVREDKATWKSNYFMRIIQYLDEYPKLFLVGVDNVGSKQMQQIRQSLRGRAEVLMGKNTMIRKAIRGHLDNNPALEKYEGGYAKKCGHFKFYTVSLLVEELHANKILLFLRLIPHIKGNVGFVFTKEELVDVRDLILANKVAAPAKAGALAPIDVFVPKGNTGLGPEKTSFFQALAIPTKIAKGTIEILNDVHLIKKDEKVGASEATLLTMLKILPFSYGLVIEQVYESGACFCPDVLDITTEDILGRFVEGIVNIASVSLQIGYPTVASVPHSIINGFKNLAAVAVETDITFPQVEQLKAFLENPEAFASLVPAAATETAAAPAEDTKEEKKEEEEEEESDDDMGFGLFD